MKKLIFSALAGIIVVTAGCVSTVTETSSPALTWSTDKISARYQRSVDQVYQAAVSVIQNNGQVLTEYIPHDTTNTVRAPVRQGEPEKCLGACRGRGSQNHRADHPGPLQLGRQ